MILNFKVLKYSYATLKIVTTQTRQYYFSNIDYISLFKERCGLITHIDLSAYQYTLTQYHYKCMFVINSPSTLS